MPRIRMNANFYFNGKIYRAGEWFDAPASALQGVKEDYEEKAEEAVTFSDIEVKVANLPLESESRVEKKKRGRPRKEK